ncbi:MAG: hypothetical protein IT424_12635 [Pirellulales bacterium]|nr:hypothetical protein [Pirellulales bacterium]
MRKAIALWCCLIVGMEGVAVLAGAIGGACFLAFKSPGLWPIRLEFHCGDEAPPSPALPSALPPTAAATAYTASAPAGVVPSLESAAPSAWPAPGEASIVALRGEHGSLLTGTVLGQSLSPAAEQDLFVGALRHAAAERAEADAAETKKRLDPSLSAEQAGPAAEQTATVPDELRPAVSAREEAARFAVERLYEMADVDERCGEVERADSWRSLARGLRQTALGETFIPLQTISAPAGGQSTRLDGATTAADNRELD